MLGYDLVLTNFHSSISPNFFCLQGMSFLCSDRPNAHTFNKYTVLLNSHCVQGTLLGKTGLKGEKKEWLFFFFKLCLLFKKKKSFLKNASVALITLWSKII